MLGHDMISALEGAGQDVTAMALADLDITVAAAVLAAVRNHRPDVVVNCAAWTAVDDAEAHEDEAHAVNGRGAEHVAAACGQSGAALVQISTDYVFSGTARHPYAEGDPCAPRTVYGRTKLAGEQAVLRLLPGAAYVVRTAWLYGAHGPNFVRSMIRLEKERATVDVVDDQYGQPTWTADVARQVIALVRARAGSGIYHATSSGETTWCGLAREVFRLLGASPARVRPTTSAAYPRPAPRPSYSVLGHDAWAPAGIGAIGDWRSALKRAFPVLDAAR